MTDIEYIVVKVGVTPMSDGRFPFEMTYPILINTKAPFAKSEGLHSREEIMDKMNEMADVLKELRDADD